MNTSYPNISVSFKQKAYSLDVTNTNQNTLNRFKVLNEVTNYEYEVKLNEEKRQILILKPEYLNAFISDMKNMMKYDKSSQTIDKNTKRAYNPKLKGV